MRFRQVDDWCYASECGHFRVAKVSMNNLPRYEAWTRIDDGVKWRSIAVNLATAKEAKRQCEIYEPSRLDLLNPRSGSHVGTSEAAL